MNEELQEQLAEVIKRSLNLAEKTGEFVLDQAPDLVQQFIMWHTMQAVVWIVFGFLLNLVWLYFLSNKVKEWVNDNYAEPLYILPSLVSIISIVIIMVNTLLLVKILVAPKIYLIEYFLK